MAEHDITPDNVSAALSFAALSRNPATLNANGEAGKVNRDIVDRGFDPWRFLRDGAEDFIGLNDFFEATMTDDEMCQIAGRISEHLGQLKARPLEEDSYLAIHYVQRDGKTSRAVERKWVSDKERQDYYDGMMHDLYIETIAIREPEKWLSDPETGIPIMRGAILKQLLQCAGIYGVSEPDFHAYSKGGGFTGDKDKQPHLLSLEAWMKYEQEWILRSQ